jgi:hypothetical protein
LTRTAGGPAPSRPCPRAIPTGTGSGEGSARTLWGLDGERGRDTGGETYRGCRGRDSCRRGLATWSAWDSGGVCGQLGGLAAVVFRDVE